MKRTIIYLVFLLGVLLFASQAQASPIKRKVCHGFSYKGVRVHDLIAHDVSCKKATALTKRYYDVASPSKHNGFRVSGAWKGYPGPVGGPVIRNGVRGAIKIHGPAYRPSTSKPPAAKPPKKTKPPYTPPACDYSKPAWLNPVDCIEPAAPLSCKMWILPPTSGPDYALDNAGLLGNSTVSWSGGMQCNKSGVVVEHFWLTDGRISHDHGQGGVWNALHRVSGYADASGPFGGPVDGTHVNDFYNNVDCGPIMQGLQGDGHTIATTTGNVEAFVYESDTVIDLEGVIHNPGPLLGSATSAPVPVQC